MFISYLIVVRIITIHIYYTNLITGENSYSKLSLVDLAGSEGSIGEEDSGEHVTELLHVMKSLSAYATNLIFYHVAIFELGLAACLSA